MNASDAEIGIPTSTARAPSLDAARARRQPGGPLADVRVADFTWVGAGPFATKMLAEFGADVIKVESTRRTDSIRTMHPFAAGLPGLNRSGYFANRNPNKRSICLNIRSEEGRRIALDLIAASDVVANNFTAGTMDRLGLGYDVACTVNPSVVYLSMPMVGEHGPHSGHAGYGLMLAALSGLFGLSGHPDRMPAGTGTNYPDHVPNPLHAAVAVLAAIRHRDRTGRGQHVELAQLESTINAVGGAVLEASITGATPVRAGNSDPRFAPHGVFPCRGDDRWCAIAVRGDDEWSELCAVLDIQATLPDEWSHATGRLAAAADVNRMVATSTALWEVAELAEALAKRGIAASPVADARDVVTADPQLAFRGHWVALDHAEMGTMIYDRTAAQLSSQPPGLVAAAPLLGEHTAEVAREVLGMDEATFDRLQSDGVFS